MGLDNGIMMKKKYAEVRAEAPRFIHFPWEEYCDKDSDTTEVCYWRKYWGFRNIIMEKLHAEDDAFVVYLDVEDVEMILRELIKCFNSEYFKDNEISTIWTYEDALYQMMENQLNLIWLIDYMKENPDIEVYWYDSY